MTKIFFFSPNGPLPMRDESVKTLCRAHAWQPEGETWIYGVAIPKPGVDPNEVVDALTQVGVMVIPGVHDRDTAPPGQAIAALAKHGITPNDKGLDVARKMHAASGMPALRPHLF